MAVQKFLNKKELLLDFSFEVACVEGEALSVIFWADEQAKHNYFSFGDVFSFDATFRTNKYNMVFVPFTGIDNHGKSVTFGAGLLSSETIESYSWLLKAFKNAFGREPLLVVTDQDPAMRQAVHDVFSTSTHRLCMWHIMEKLTTKVGANTCNNTGFKSRIHNIGWNDKLEPEEFEKEWTCIINDFNLEGHKWLSDMFAIRDRWIPAYFRDLPMSGLMRTTSRSESVNHFFGQMMSTKLSLVEYHSHFETAMEFQRAVQRKNDHNSRYTTPEIRTQLQFEKEAADIYTHAMFEKVRDEIQASLMSCMSTNVSDSEGVKRYTVEDTVNDNQYEVIHTEDDGVVICSCKLFERFGFLCRHIFYVLRLSKVNEFPRRYINRRWTKDAAPNPVSGMNCHMISDRNDETKAIVRDIYYSVDCCVNHLVGDFNNLAIFRDKQKEIMAEVEADLPIEHYMTKKDVIGSLLGLPQPEEVIIQVPNGIRNKGCGSGKKLISKREEAIRNASRRKRLCRACNQLVDHDSRNCPKKSMSSGSVIDSSE